MLLKQFQLNVVEFIGTSDGEMFWNFGQMVDLFPNIVFVCLVSVLPGLLHLLM